MRPLHNPYFVKFIVYFNENQDFFECHEVLEDYWKSIPNRTKDHILTAYILLSTGMYHWRRGNTVGGLRTLKNAYAKLATAEKAFPDFTDDINFKALCKNVQQAIYNIENGRPFTSFPIIVMSTKLMSLVKEIKKTMTLLPLGSDALIHKHMRRDRSDILRIRNEKKKGRIS